MYFPKREELSFLSRRIRLGAQAIWELLQRPPPVVTLNPQAMHAPCSAATPAVNNGALLARMPPDPAKSPIGAKVWAGGRVWAGSWRLLRAVVHKCGGGSSAAIALRAVLHNRAMAGAPACCLCPSARRCSGAASTSLVCGGGYATPKPLVPRQVQTRPKRKRCALVALPDSQPPRTHRVGCA